MKINTLLEKKIIWAGSEMRFTYFCNYLNVDQKLFMAALLVKYARKNMSEEEFILKINEKLKKPIKKIHYDKNSKRISFKITGIKIEFAFICKRTKEHCNIGSILIKLRKFIEKNEIKVRNKTRDITECQNWYVINRLARNPQIKFLGIKNES